MLVGRIPAARLEFDEAGADQCPLRRLGLVDEEIEILEVATARVGIMHPPPPGPS